MLISQLIFVHVMSASLDLDQIHLDQIPKLPSGEILAESDIEYVVVIPDIHGDFEAAIDAVYMAFKTIKEDQRVDEFESPDIFRANLLQMIKRRKSQPDNLEIRNEIFETASVALVQMGDVINKGPHSEECLDLFRAIPFILGWRVLNLYGDHDVRTLTSDATKYVHIDELRKFEDVAHTIEWASKRTACYRPGGKCYQIYMESFLALARITSRGGSLPWGPGDPRNPSTLFAHAGFNLEWFFDHAKKFSEFQDISDGNFIDDFNKAVRNVLQSDRFNDEKFELFGMNRDAKSEDKGKPKSFLWTRKMARGDCRDLDSLLEFFNVNRIVVGHTMRQDRKIGRMCDDRLIVVDVGMSRWRTNERSSPQPTCMIMKTRVSDFMLESITGYYERATEEIDIIYKAPATFHHFKMPLASLSSDVPSLPSGEISTLHYDRIVIIPDTHGDLDAAIKSVYMAHKTLTDPRHWSFKEFKRRILRAIKQLNSGRMNFPNKESRILLIQMGDLVDRGPYSRECIDLFEVLPSILGWRVLKLYGNHDMLNLNGNPVGEVSPAELELLGMSFEERRQLFRPEGVYYERYTHSYLGMIRLTGSAGLESQSGSNTLFVHAGFDIEWWKEVALKSEPFEELSGVQMSLEYINLLNQKLRDFVRSEQYTDKFKSDFFDNPFANEVSGLMETSFLWTRSVPDAAATDEDLARRGLQPNSKHCSQVDAVLEFFHVSQIIVGHTPQENGRVKHICGAKFIITDVGMSKWMNKRSGVVESRPFAVIMSMEENELQSIVAYYNDESQDNIFPN
jgi:hypothetical protein